ncbi:protein CEBPZOS-like isoform X1 [Apostichopus japonicus]|uniref:protein CEBPZOS-like isoform X1 n=1 Tax=Stichopus japonicus TaxID=307972 RepID=UPI003AB5FDA8
MTVYRIRAGSCYGIEEVTGSCVPKYFSMNWNRHGASLWKGMKWLLYAEIVAIGAGYYVWHKMNVSEEYRKQMYEKHPYVLEGFYRTGEFGGIRDARSNDYKKWGVISEETNDGTSR